MSNFWCSVSGHEIDVVSVSRSMFARCFSAYGQFRAIGRFLYFSFSKIGFLAARTDLPKAAKFPRSVGICECVQQHHAVCFVMVSDL